MFANSFFFFKQKTAYEMRISDWSSDVCSSDLGPSQVDCCAYRRASGACWVPPTCCDFSGQGRPDPSADIKQNFQVHCEDSTRLRAWLVPVGAPHPFAELPYRLRIHHVSSFSDRKSTRLNSSH